MTCPVCRGSTDEGTHGTCIERFALVMRHEIERLRADRDRLRNQLIDAGILRKGGL